MKRQYPTVYWPAEPQPDDAIGMVTWPETIRIDPTGFGQMWIDLEGEPGAEQR
jgi:hypothetical protein